MASRTILLITAGITLIIVAGATAIVRLYRPAARSASPVRRPVNPPLISRQSIPAPPEPSPMPAKPHRGALSPFAIKRYVEQKGGKDVSLEQFWQRLGIETEEWRTYGNCQADVFRLQLDSEPGDEVMLRLYDASGWSMGGTRYLFFKPRRDQRKTKWTLLGFLDLEEQRYRAPPHLVYTAGGRRWLILTILRGRGSGYGLYHDSWYEIGRQGAAFVLSYPSSLFRWRPDLDLELHASSQVLGAAIEAGKAEITVRFSIRYRHSQSGKTLWSKKQIAVFTRPTESTEFVFDKRRSSLSKK